MLASLSLEPNGFGEGLGPAIEMLGLGMGTVLIVLAALTLLIWALGLMRDRPPRAAHGATRAEASSVSGAAALAPSRPDAAAALVAAALAVHLERDGADPPAIGSPGRESNAWGSAGYAGRHAGAVPPLRRT